ncbi:MAG: TetR/AcrR family transcriptional regulator [Anaerolineaceae bacterium]|nr:TetR/AcrR family transcriptional regulator [Anaerolineaceae bacterium]
MENRNKILDCALELFSARGYESVGVQEIALAAGITKPTLYHYFGSKTGLLEALLEQYHAPLNQSIREAATYQGDLPMTLEKIAEAFFIYARQNPQYYRMQLALLFAPRESETCQLALKRNEAQYQMIEKLFRVAVKDHGNMAGRQNQFAVTFIGMVNTYISMGLNGQIDLDQDLVYRIVRQFQHGIYSG